MPPKRARNFPLFPLDVVALPSEGVPLHIFEERYRVMIGRCLEAQPGSPHREFGIVWLSDEELKPVGCACEVEEVSFSFCCGPVASVPCFCSCRAFCIFSYASLRVLP